MRWKYLFASAPGKHHKKNSIPCQDSYDLRVMLTSKGEPVLLAAVSDGAGSALYAHIGSRLAVSSIMEDMEEFIETKDDIGAFTRKDAENMVISFQNEVLKYEKAMDSKSRDFACTLLVAAIGIDNAVFFQIGDGAIVVSTSQEPDDFLPIFWPATGEYENTTYFAVGTDSTLVYMEYKLIQRRIDDLAIFTDGMQRIALHYQSRTAYAPFFKPMFAYLKSIPDICPYKSLNSLTSFLNSEKVNKMTNDDKTLILASRCDE